MFRKLSEKEFLRAKERRKMQIAKKINEENRRMISLMRIRKAKISKLFAFVTKVNDFITRKITFASLH